MCADGTMNAQCSGRCSSQSCAVELAKQTMAFEDMIMSENVHYVLYFLMNVSVSRLIKMETLHDCYSEPQISSPQVLLALLVRGLNHGV